LSLFRDDPSGSESHSVEILQHCSRPLRKVRKPSLLDNPSYGFVSRIIDWKETVKLTTLSELYVEELRDLYSAENQVVRALPKMAKAASGPLVRRALTDQLHQTQVHLSRLEQIIDRLGIGPKGRECKVIELLIAENKDTMSEDAQPTVRDAALIAAIQRLDHYEMAGYGCVRNFARQLGYNQAADALQTTLDEICDWDKGLSELANAVIGSGLPVPVGRETPAFERVGSMALAEG
jgi:ferritin-like metal-binding protein YciE